MDINKKKKDFPIFTNYPDLVYLDSAATSQKPQVVIDAVSNFYSKFNSNVHRGIYDLSEEASRIVDDSRTKIAEYIGASSSEEIVFTGNASEAINIVATGYAGKFLKAGDIVVTSEMEHHSNIVPWLRLKKEVGVELYYLPINKNHELEYRKILTSGLPKNKIKLIVLTHASNVLGTINPISEITHFVKKNKINAKILIDGAQSIPHLPINVGELDCDFFAFSSHKMLGPSGVGVLWSKRQLLEKMDPILFGSSMIETVTKSRATWADLPDKFEVGTRSLEAICGFGVAVDYIIGLGIENIVEHERQLTEYALEKLLCIKNLRLFGKRTYKDRLAVFSFSIGSVHPHDIGEILNRRNICVRAGHHCAQPLMKVLGVYGTTRASFYMYNNKDDIDKLVEGIEDVKKIFKYG